MSSPTTDQLATLVEAAHQARQHAYCPYSGFPVGAAVLGASGRVYPGCNVENSSYGLAMCAERVAVGTAVCAGERALLATAVYTEAARPTPPCGACRQVLAELGAESVVVMVCPSGRETLALADLLPHAFSSHELGGESPAVSARPPAAAER